MNIIGKLIDWVRIIVVGIIGIVLLFFGILILIGGMILVGSLFLILAAISLLVASFIYIRHIKPLTGH